jgi:hypothetical protein
MHASDGCATATISYGKAKDWSTSRQAVRYWVVIKRAIS